MWQLSRSEASIQRKTGRRKFVRWRKMMMTIIVRWWKIRRNIGGDNDDVCCAASCGSCGSFSTGCASLTGGPTNCCSESIEMSGTTCASDTDTSCVCPSGLLSKVSDSIPYLTPILQEISQIFANLRGLYLGCIEADFCNQVLILQHFSRSARISFLCTFGIEVGKTYSFAPLQIQ